MTLVNFTENQKKVLAEAIDVTIKEHGMNIHGQVYSLLTVLEQPVEQNEEFSTYEINGEDVKVLNTVLDTTLKIVGLKGFAQISDIVTTLVEALQNDQGQPQLADNQEQPQLDMTEG